MSKPSDLIIDWAAASFYPKYVDINVKMSKAHQPQTPIAHDFKLKKIKGVKFVNVSFEKI